MGKITVQQIFDAAWQKFIVEGAPPALHAGFCAYRTPDGRACAVGLCLPDGHPSTRSGDAFDDLIEAYPELFAPDVLALSGESAERFQRWLHDGHVDTYSGTWRNSINERAQAYRQVAKEYGLTVPESAE